MMAYRDVLYLKNVLYLANGGTMETPRRYNAFTSDGTYAWEYDESVGGVFCKADEVIAAIAELNAEIERLRSELEAEQARTICYTCGEELTRMASEQPSTQSEVWQPLTEKSVMCACGHDCKDHINLWSDTNLQVINYSPDRCADMILPDDVRLCRMVTP